MMFNFNSDADFNALHLLFIDKNLYYVLKKARIALNSTPMTDLRDVTCHIGSHSVTCYPTQVNAPRPNPSPQAGTRFTYPKGWRAELA